MPSIFDWSTTASDNDDADSAINWLENQNPNTVNNSARAMMGRVAQLLHAITGEKTTAGTADAQTLSTGLGWSSLAPMLLAFKAGAALTNTGAMTLNVDGFGAVAVKTVTGAALPAGAVTAGGVYLVAYESTAAVWVLLTPKSLMPGNNLSDLASATTALTNLGLTANGKSLVTAADYAAMRALLDLEVGTDFLSIAAIAAAYQPLDSDLTAIAALTTTTFGRAFLALADEAAFKAAVNLEASVDVPAIVSTSTIPIGIPIFAEYTSASALTNGSTTAGTNVSLPTAQGSGFTSNGQAQTGTWKNISGATMQAGGSNSRGYMVRTA